MMRSFMANRWRPYHGSRPKQRSVRRACLPLQSLIFPEPQEISSSGSDFVLDNQAPVVVPSNASKEDLFLAGSLVNELSDRFGLHLKIERATKLSANRRAILMGSIENPLVRQYCAEMELRSSVQGLGPESYIIRTNNNVVLVAGNDDRGAFYGYSLSANCSPTKRANCDFAARRFAIGPTSRFEGSTCSSRTRQYPVLQALRARLHGAV